MSFSWDDCRQLDSLCYDLVLGDFHRGQNRALIQSLANGSAPYTDDEAEENQVVVNVNDLTHTRLCHDARTQYANAFLKTGNFAKATTDAGPAHKHSEWSAIVTKAWNRPMKRSIAYFERLRAEFGMLVLHGIAPGAWENRDKWCPNPHGIEDVLLPSQTRLGFDNLPFIVLRRTLTGPELQRLTRATKRSPGWRMPMVNACLDWLGKEMVQLRSANWPEVWSPEKVQERVKEDGGYFMGDQAPKLDMFDIYGYVDNGQESGWIRRIILDGWSEPSISGGNLTMSRNTKSFNSGTIRKDDFVYSSGKRFVARSWEEIMSFQFADLSAVFPARYHSVRSLGWLIYASCHLGNRMRCKFYEAVFESLMQLYRVKSADDAANALKLNLVNRGFIDDSIKPVPAQERWQVPAQLIELGLSDNAQVTSKNSSAWTTTPLGDDRTEKTRFQVMAELQQMTQLVGAGLNQAYMYHAFEFREIFRRFCRARSTDPDVREFQAYCLRHGVPMKYLQDSSAWDIEPERIMGSGNKTLEMNIAAQLMEWRDKFDPEPQRAILKDAVLAITDDPARAAMLVPESPLRVTAGKRDAEIVAGTLMQGIPVDVMEGINHIETIETLLRILAEKIKTGLQQGGMVENKELSGLYTIAQHIAGHIQIVAQDEQEKQRVKRYGDILGRLVNELKAFQQRLQEAMQKQAGANGNGGLDPKDAAKIQADQLQAQVKAKNAQDSHAQRTAQRQLQFEQKMQQDEQKHAAELAKLDVEAAGNIRRNRMEQEEPGGE